MATLHVRNVPDELYELLRERAAANDRSIGAETVQLLQERLELAGAPRPPRRLPVPGRRRGGTGLFTRFTEEAREVVVDAEERARSLGHDHVGTEHLLLGVLGRGAGTPLVAGLQALGVTRAGVEEKVERSPGQGDAQPQGQIPFEPAAKQALELALREALKLRDDAIAPGHLLLGVLRQKTGRGAQILGELQPDASKLRRCAAAGRNPEPGASFMFPMRPRASFRVVPLEGDAQNWEAELNAAAAQGYDLLEIVDGRAILRRQ
jgi:ATP-dependent Clp protease ATP-binding subunit ClpC